MMSRAHQRLVRIAGLNGFENVAGVATSADAIPGLEPDPDQAEEQRIGHRDRQQVLSRLTATHTRFSDTSWESAHSRSGVLREVDAWKAEPKGERFRDLFFSREVHAHEHDANAFALRLCSANAACGRPR
jgi:hypothetical protein